MFYHDENKEFKIRMAIRTILFNSDNVRLFFFFLIYMSP